MNQDCQNRIAEIVIPKEKAVFWMDGQGRWHNQHGLFENKKIIDHFNASIRKDMQGYFVGQHRDGIYEKVYFTYQQTALFVTDVQWGNPVQMILNTGQRMDLSPECLFIRDDQLFHRKGDEIVKFTERTLTMISEAMTFAGDGYTILVNSMRYTVPEV